LHQAGNEVAWWENLKIDAMPIAKGLWEKSRKGVGSMTTAQTSNE